MLYKLLAHTDRRMFAPEVISMLDMGRIGMRLGDLDVPVHTLRMHPGVPNSAGMVCLVCHLRKRRQDMIQTWMYHADLVGSVAAKLTGVPVVWGIHQTDLSREGHPALIRYTIEACRRLSGRIPARIVCCSMLASKVHASLGYAAEKIVVIPNGFDLSLSVQLLQLSGEQRQQRGLAARARVESEFNVTTIATRYEQVYRAVVDREPSRCPS